MKTTHVAFWPGREVKVCLKHLAQLSTVAETMGFPLSARPLPEDEQEECKNCLNEAAKSRFE